MEEKKPGWIYYFINIFAILFFLGSASVYFYPMLSNVWNRYRNSQLISEYTDTVSELAPKDFSEYWEAARAYNDQHTENVIIDAFDENSEEYILTHPYDTLLNPTGNEVMGYIDIPCIDVTLAIYHGISPDVLDRGCGHIEGTSLPIGGPGTHAALSAHRGLPSAKLFTDLDQIVEGDQFYLHILDEILAYEVDQILTVLPEEVDDLAIIPEEDLVTLVTCTPYAVNTHRLLVRGHRVPYVELEEPEKSLLETIVPEEDRTVFLTVVSGLIALNFSGFCLIIWKLRKKKKEKREKNRSLEQK